MVVINICWLANIGQFLHILFLQECNIHIGQLRGMYLRTHDKLSNRKEVRTPTSKISSIKFNYSTKIEFTRNRWADVSNIGPPSQRVALIVITLCIVPMLY